MENFIEKQLLDAAEKFTEIVAENTEAATSKVEFEVESEVQVKLEPLEEIEVHSVEEEAQLQLDDEAGKLYVEILIENKEIKTENEEESFESPYEASTYLAPTSSRSRSRSSTPESSPMRPIITSPVSRRQPPTVEELSETSESSTESEQEEDGDETFVMKELDDEMNAYTDLATKANENYETESKPDSNKKVEATKDEAQEIADAAGEIQEAANEISGNRVQLEKVAVVNDKSESKVEERLSIKREMHDKQSDGIEKKKKTSDMDPKLCS